MEEPAAIVLTVTTDVRHARVARATVAAAAVLEDFSVDRLDDVRLVVDEVFNAMRATGAPAVVLTVNTTPGTLALSARGMTTAHSGVSYALLRVLSDAVATSWALKDTSSCVTYVATITATPR